MMDVWVDGWVDKWMDGDDRFEWWMDENSTYVPSDSESMIKYKQFYKALYLVLQLFPPIALILLTIIEILMYFNPLF